MSDFDKFMSHLDDSHDAVWQVARGEREVGAR